MLPYLTPPLRCISIHALLAESDARRGVVHGHDGISIHALLAESDNILFYNKQHAFEFLSTLSLRRATLSQTMPASSMMNFYPRSPCGERPPVSCAGLGLARISIHALLAESDYYGVLDRNVLYRFLSTLSLRRATFALQQNYQRIIISIHALLAESDTESRLTGKIF